MPLNGIRRKEFAAEKITRVLCGRGRGRAVTQFRGPKRSPPFVASDGPGEKIDAPCVATTLGTAVEVNQRPIIYQREAGRQAGEWREH